MLKKKQKYGKIKVRVFNTEDELLYRALIVKKDKFEVDRLINIVHNADKSIEIDVTDDSNSALTYIENGHYDILLLDVGDLELVHKAKNMDEDIEAIIVTGCEEFDIVKKALRYGAMDYVLYSEAESYLTDRLKDYFNWLRADEQPEYVTDHLVQMVLNGSNISELAKNNNLSFLEEYHRMILIDFNKDFFSGKGIEFKENFAKEKFPELKYVNLNQQQGLFLCKATDDLVKLAENIIGKVFVFYHEKCYAAISSEFMDCYGMRAAMEELDSLIEDKFYYSPGEVFCADRENDNDAGVSTEDDMLIKKIKQAIKLKDIRGLRSNYEKFGSKYRNRTNFSQVYVKFLFANILKDIYEAIPGAGEERFGLEVDALYRVNDINSVVAVIGKAIDKFESAVMENPSTHHKELSIVKEYIYENYGNEISVDKLAEMVFMSASYLSSVFKRETGENLSYFIKAYRMERAKEMLESTVYKIGDISNKSGYPNVSYFCSTFRTHFGVSPQKYRENGMGTVKNEQKTIED